MLQVGETALGGTRTHENQGVACLNSLGPASLIHNAPFQTQRFQLVWHEHRSRVVLAALRHSSGRLLYVASCHLEGAPWEAATRWKQTKSALNRIQKDQEKRNVDPEACALVFAGDFNGPEGSASCECLRSGGLLKDFRDPWAPNAELEPADYTHDFKLSDLYASGFANRPPTFAAPPERGPAHFTAIDFMFYSHRTLRPVAVRVPFTKAQATAAQQSGIPCAWHLSDHVPIGGIFEFKPEPQEDTDAGRSRRERRQRGRRPIGTHVHVAQNLAVKPWWGVSFDPKNCLQQQWPQRSSECCAPCGCTQVAASGRDGAFCACCRQHIESLAPIVPPTHPKKKSFAQQRLLWCIGGSNSTPRELT